MCVYFYQRKKPNESSNAARLANKSSNQSKTAQVSRARTYYMYACIDRYIVWERGISKILNQRFQLQFKAAGNRICILEQMTN